MGGKKKTKVVAVPPKVEEISEREEAARVELEHLNEELHCIKKEVDRLRKENEWLKDEASQTKMESHEYLQYMSRKTQKRQSTIASLNERNAEELGKVVEARAEVLKKYEFRKQDLKNQIMAKEDEFTQITRDLQDLSEYQAFRLEQEAEIQRLEAEVDRLKLEHAEKLQQMKCNFLKEKAAYEKDADVKIKQMKQQANDEALHCLSEHTQKINRENRQLRRELLSLIRKSQSLSQHKMELLNQHKSLVREHQITKDLKKIRQVHVE